MVSSIQSTASYLSNPMKALRNELNELNNQLSSGHKSSSFVELAKDRDLYTATQSTLSETDAYKYNATMVEIRFNTITNTLNTVDQSVEDSLELLNDEKLSLNDSVPTLSQRTSRDFLSTIVDSMNVDVAGRYIFGGHQTDIPPLVPIQEMLDGIDGKAGFVEVMAERWQADEGSSGLGRLALNRTSGIVSLAEDSASHPFGFKIDSVNSTLSQATASAPTAPLNTVDVDFSAGNPAAGEALSFNLTLPTGASHTLTLTAQDEASNEAGAFVIDAGDSTVTAENFRTSLETLIQQAVEDSLRRDSALQASEDFFFSATQGNPLRADTSGTGDPTALITASSDTTVFWYQGDPTTDNPRYTAQAQVSKQITANHGILANEQPFADSIRNLAVLSTFTFSSTTEEGLATHASMKTTLAEQLASVQSKNGIESIHRDMTIMGTNLARAKDNNEQAQGLAKGILADIQDVDKTELAVRLNALINQIEASYTVNQRLQNLNLLNYIQ